MSEENKIKRQKITLKICRYCGKKAFNKKDLEKHFRKDKRCKYGYVALCKKCHYKKYGNDMKAKLRNQKSSKKNWKKYYGGGPEGLSYQGLHVRGNFPPKTHCEICGRKIGEKIKRLARHHWLYEFTKKQVKENPMLGLRNTVVVCYPCHRLSDSLRGIYDINRWERLIKLIATMPEPMKLEFASRLRDLAFQISELIGEDY